MAKRSKLSQEARDNRVQKMLRFRSAVLENVDDYRVRVMKGNTKTGSLCWTVSLIPIVDCPHGCTCCVDCYDIRNDCFRPDVQRTRAINSAIHLDNRERYWRDIDEQIKANNIRYLRLNVGGDLGNEDFAYVVALGEINPNTNILFFTKNYRGINRFLELNSFPDNIHAILSAWKGMKMDNPHNLPCSHVLWEDGTTTAPDYGAYYCGGNCSECAHNGEGCWTLKNGEHVIFHAH